MPRVKRRSLDMQRKLNRERGRRRRAAESYRETQLRRESARRLRAQTRAAETPEETQLRRTTERLRKARAKAKAKAWAAVEATRLKELEGGQHTTDNRLWPVKVEAAERECDPLEASQYLSLSLKEELPEEEEGSAAKREAMTQLGKGEAKTPSEERKTATPTNTPRLPVKVEAVEDEYDPLEVPQYLSLSLKEESPEGEGEGLVQEREATTPGLLVPSLVPRVSGAPGEMPPGDVDMGGWWVRPGLLPHTSPPHTSPHTSGQLDGSGTYCPICKKKMRSRNELQGHLRTHTGEKPHVCDICQRGFALPESLTNHKKIHGGKMLYECDICHKGFARSDILMSHRRSHTGETRYKCDICIRGFGRSDAYTKHMRIQHGEMTLNSNWSAAII